MCKTKSISLGGPKSHYECIFEGKCFDNLIDSFLKMVSFKAVSAILIIKSFNFRRTQIFGKEKLKSTTEAPFSH